MIDWQKFYAIMNKGVYERFNTFSIDILYTRSRNLITNLDVKQS